MNKNKMLDRAAEVVLVVVCFALYAWWAYHLPQTMAPDEYMRYDIPLFIFDNGYLPLGDDPAIRNPIWGTSYGYSVYGSSFLALCFMRVASLFGASSTDLLIAARFSSVVFSAGTVYICLRIGERLFPRYLPGKYMLAVFVGFLPQFVFISSYFNSDAMEIFCTSLVILCWLRGLASCWRWGDCICLGLSLGLCALSYYFAYGAILASIFVFYTSMHTITKRDKAQTKNVAASFIGKPLVIMFVALIVAGWFFVRNAILYDGDFIGMSASSAASELYALEGYKPSSHLTPRNEGLSVVDMLFSGYNGSNWVVMTAKSFIGLFGYMSVLLDREMYLCYLALIGIGATVFVIMLFAKAGKEDSLKKIIVFGLIALIIIPLILSIYYSWSSDYQPQGRYLFAALVPLMIAVTSGYAWIASLFSPQAVKLDKHLMKRKSLLLGTFAEKALPFALMIVWVLLFMWVFATQIVVFCTGAVL